MSGRLPSLILPFLGFCHPLTHQPLCFNDLGGGYRRPLASTEPEKEPPRRTAQFITGRRHKDGMRILRDGPVTRTVERENGTGMVNEWLTKRRAYCRTSEHLYVGIV